MPLNLTEGKQCQHGAYQAENGQPPDVPNHGEAGDDRKKKAVTNPFALFLGISIDSYRSAGRICPRCFMAQKASNEST